MKDTPTKKTRGYSPEEVASWDRSIREKKDRGLSWTEIAAELGIHATTLQRWRYRLGLE